MDKAKVDKYFLKISIVSHPDYLLHDLIHIFGEGKFSTDWRPMQGRDVVTQDIHINNTDLRLILQEISSSPGFAKLRPSYYRGSLGAIFAFLKSNHDFSDSIKALYREFRQFLPPPVVPVVFIGLRNDSEVVTTVEGQELAQELGVDYYEMAVDDLQTLDVVLRSLAKKFLEKQEK